jgi:hypothetical protein
VDDLGWEWKGVPLGDTATYACQLAATELGSREALSTGRLLLALSRVDLHGRWSRVWVRTGYPAPEVLGAARDANHAELATTWHDVPVSGDLARSLSLVADFAAEKDMVPVPAGLLALGLLTDEDAGATRTLLADNEIGHDELLTLVEHELLGPREQWRTKTTGEQHQQGTAWVERAARQAGSRPPDDLDLLAVVIDSGTVERPSSNELLAQMHDELADEARLFGTRPAAAVVESAREEFGVMVPNAQQVMFALTDRPSPALTELVDVTGITTRQLAAGAMTELDDRIRTQPVRNVDVWSIVNMVLMFGALTLILRNAVSTDGWWELLFLPAVFLGPPAVSAWFPGICATGLLVLDAAAGAVLAADALVGWLRERAERGGLTAWTGVRLTLAEYRAFVQRRRYTAATRARMDAALAPLRASWLVSRASRVTTREQS